MSLNIDNAEIEARMRQLAAKTGLAIIEAVDVAVREKLDNMRVETGEDKVQNRINAVMLFLQDMGELPKIDQQKIAGELYDEFGVER